MRFTQEMEWLHKFGNPTADKISEHLANYAILLEDVKEYANYYGLSLAQMQDRLKATGITKEEAFARLKKAAEAMGVDLRVNTQRRKYTDMRSVVAYLMLKYTGITTIELGKWLDKHYSSIIHMKNKSEALIKRDVEYTELVTKMERALLEDVIEPEAIQVVKDATYGYYSSKQAAQEMNCTVKTVRERADRGLIKRIKINNLNYYCAHSVGRLKQSLNGRRTIQAGFRHY